MDEMDLLSHNLTRQQQLTHESEQWRLQQTARATPKSAPKDPIYAPALAKVGEMMVELGTQLQTKYSVVLGTPPTIKRPNFKHIRS